jgi:transposase
MIYSTLYEHLELNRRRHINYPWPKTVGIDEHFFSRSKGYREFATVLVDFNNKRVRELVLGRTSVDLNEALKEIPGRENVKNVVLDLSDPYKSFTKNFFPNAKLIADKFHVLRLLTPAINRYRKQITGDKRTNPIRKLLLRNGKDLEYYEKKALYEWLDEHEDLKTIYHFKESMHGLYRINNPKAAAKALTGMTDRMALSKIPEIKTLRKTMMKWRNEILNYFENRITNARTEGFNNVAKLIQKRAYGVKSFKFYRLRYLNACA